MFELAAGLLLIAFWGFLQFVLQPTTGLIHLALAAGVISIIRGIVRLSPGTPVRR
ncbi:MAG: hypothetical protein IPP98_13395 [Gemmatimonadetes bacterium]|nr:hypothetical protein [Gemmatimonadota bacterium]